MDELLRNLLLVLCGLGAVVLLVLTYLWYFVFGRSLRAVLMAGLSIMMNRDSTIDMNADPKVTKRPEDAKQEMTQEVAALDFDGEVSSQSQYVPVAEDAEDYGTQSVSMKFGKQELVSSSFRVGRFRRVVAGIMRPFLRSRLDSHDDGVPNENLPFKKKPPNNK